jgi:hypothetical protein
MVLRNRHTLEVKLHPRLLLCAQMSKFAFSPNAPVFVPGRLGHETLSDLAAAAGVNAPSIAYPTNKKTPGHGHTAAPGGARRTKFAFSPNAPVFVPGRLGHKVLSDLAAAAGVNAPSIASPTNKKTPGHGHTAAFGRARRTIPAVRPVDR